MSDPQPQRARSVGATLLFSATIGLGSLLLFSVQLVIGKSLLPWFGGTSALWTTCLLFFQAALLAGYAWAHALSHRTAPARQRSLHLVLLAAAVLLLVSRAGRWPSPITPGDSLRPDTVAAPLATALGLLAATVGLPFLALAATSPLLSAWYARLRPGGDPFRLYAVSNAGSLLGLVGYPLLLEPLASVRTQGWLWSAAFLAYAGGMGACAVKAGRMANTRTPSGQNDEPPPSLAARLLWVALAAAPSLLLVAVTSHLTQEVAPVPLLWMLPFALYLLSFILCFARRSLGRRAAWSPLLALAAALSLLGLHRTLELGVRGRVLLWCVVLFVYAMASHGELVRRQPTPGRLTSYYLLVSFGGVLGGAFCALVAPRLFDGYWELHTGLLAAPIAVGASWALDPASFLRSGADRVAGLRAAIAGSAGLLVLAGALLLDVAVARRGVLTARRGFYGVLRVVHEQPGSPDEQLKLLHGLIAHGLQLLQPERRQEPTTYFGPTSGVGLAIERHPRRLAGQPLRVGVVGLGVGTLACWGRAGDVFRFYELDPEVARLSEGNPPVFTYLRDTRAAVSVQLGDGRLALERENGQRFDVLVLDAFSSDAIPVHLLTREAFLVYERHLRPDGVLAVHVTNRHLELKPVVRGAARECGFIALHVPSYERGTQWPSDWMLLARDRRFAEDEVISAASLPPPEGAKIVTWSDDWSDLLRVLKR